MLTEKNKKKWTKALRSGEYLQGTETLKHLDTDIDEFKFCCLGVALDIGLSKQNHSEGEFVSTDFLPMDTQEKLAKFNDGGKSFKWIASYIERYL